MKPCIRCGTVKPKSEFYNHPKMQDGTINACKECVKRDSDKRYKKLMSTSIEFLSGERLRHREKQAMYRKLGKQCETSKESKDAWVARNKDKRAAHLKIRNAIRSKKINRPNSCDKCGETGRIEGHHPDYAKPLSVEWLCPSCHGKTKWKPLTLCTN